MDKYDSSHYDNVKYKKSFGCIKKKLHWNTQPTRNQFLNVPDTNAGDNYIATAKYNLVNFIPLNLYEPLLVIKYSQLNN